MAIDTTARVLTVRDTVVSMINTDAATFSGTVADASNASPIVVVVNANHGLTDEQDVTIASVLGNTAANGTWTIKKVSADTFSLVGSTGNGTYTSGGTWTCTRFTATANFLPEYRLAQLTVPQVDVRIVREETEPADRRDSSSSTEDVYYLEITLQKEIGADDTARLDYWVSLGKRIAKLFYPNKALTGLTPPVVVISNDHELYDEFILREFGVFSTKIELALREYL